MQFLLALLLLASSANAEHEGGKTMPPPTHMTRAPRTEMYSELIYLEKFCRDYSFQPVRTELDANGNFTFEIGDRQGFKCDLYENAVNYGQYGGEKVGETFLTCKIIAFQDIILPDAFRSFDNVAIWDCTITDYLGEGPNVDDDETYIRNEGDLLLFDAPFFCDYTFNATSYTGVDCTRNRIRQDALWREFHSHTGTFATVGGVALAKGSRGQMEIQWDYYKMTWFHVYTIEVWALEQPTIPLYGSHHRSY